jgi:hypothetical protein
MEPEFDVVTISVPSETFSTFKKAAFKGSVEAIAGLIVTGVATLAYRKFQKWNKNRKAALIQEVLEVKTTEEEK